MNPNEIVTAIKAPSQPHRRLLAIEEQRYLARLLSTAFKTDISEKTVEKIMNYITYAEKRMVGRMASHVEDLIIHYLMRYFASMIDAPADAAHMEIGTLFGGTVLLAHHAMGLAEKSFPIHVIDPFEGYYGQGQDIITGESIDERNFLKNLKNLEIPKGDVVIHKGLSTDPAIIGECGSIRLLSLLIDGDHSYEGIKNDWINFAHLVVPGGYVLIDNYNDQYWPDVMRYINNEVLPRMGGRWEVVLVHATSLLLRRTSVEEPDDSTEAQRLYLELRAREKELGETWGAKLKEAEKERQQLLDDKQQLLGDKQQLLAEKQPLLEEKQQLLAEKQQLLEEKQQLLEEKQRIVDEIRQMTEGKAEREGEIIRLREEQAGLTAELKKLHELYLATLSEADSAKEQQRRAEERLAGSAEELKQLHELYRAELSDTDGAKEQLRQAEELLAGSTEELKKLHELYLAALVEVDKANEQQKGSEQVESLRREFEEEVARLREQLATCEAESNGKGAHLADLEKELKQVHSLYVTALAETDKVNEQRHLLSGQIDALRAEIQKREAAIADLHNSLSWKITAPLRSISKPVMERKKD